MIRASADVLIQNRKIGSVCFPRTPSKISFFLMKFFDLKVCEGVQEEKWSTVKMFQEKVCTPVGGRTDTSSREKEAPMVTPFPSPTSVFVSICFDDEWQNGIWFIKMPVAVGLSRARGERFVCPRIYSCDASQRWRKKEKRKAAVLRWSWILFPAILLVLRWEEEEEERKKKEDPSKVTGDSSSWLTHGVCAWVPCSSSRHSSRWLIRENNKTVWFTI